MSDFEMFLNNDEIHVPDLIKIAIAHYQFETIHPFLDGNGRIGRLMIPLFLVSRGILDKPLLYLSEFFEKNRSVYYDKLTYTREKSDLNQWIKYFLIGIAETAESGVNTLMEIMKLKEEVENKILTMGRRAENAKKLLTGLFANPIVTAKTVVNITGLSVKAANDLIKLFLDEHILSELTKGERNRVFAFEKYVNLFNK